jgi:hypothetical protein
LNGKLGLFGVLKFLYYSRKIKGVRIMLLGVKPAFQKRGIEGLLYIETLGGEREKELSRGMLLDP